MRAVRGLKDATYCRLVESLGSPEAVLNASRDALVAQALSPSMVDAIRRGPEGATQKGIDAELRSLDRLGLSILTWHDERYPARLRTIHDPPPFLYVSGTLDPTDDYAVAVVGARRGTAAGRLLAERLSRELAETGVTVVSGMARGVDGAAHHGALSGKGRTIAVLGCGLDITYPPEHQSLRKQIEGQGAVLSDLPLGAQPHGYHFPRRNRIISGLSLGVVVVEAAIRSGSLITARLAAEQGREVFAVPGPVGSEHSRGPHGLIKQGAKLTENVDDVLEELLPQLSPALQERVYARAKAAPAAVPFLEKEETHVLSLLSSEPVHVDDAIGRSQLPAAQSPSRPALS